jgi:Rps23 Pro-64 3,4-dihydroxylase Tpa1-like proline 4-hydroxylase
MTELVNERWRRDPAGLQAAFRDAEPFPLLVLDDFLVQSFAEQLLAEFPELQEMPRSRDYVFGKKHELSSVDTHGSASHRMSELVLSPGFASFLRDATGYDVFVDPAFFGGGFHQGGDGSFLDMHVDFNLHPEHPEWLRTLNILLYLNRDWRPEWGGELLVTASAGGATRAIEPSFNRAVIMQTDEHTFHGYRKMSLPPGVTRKSIASYAYRPVEGSVRRRTTGWTPEGANLPKRLAARYYNGAVLLKNRVLGSRTASNR